MNTNDRKAYVQRILSEIDNKKEELVNISQYIWDNPELGYKEVKAKQILTNYLEKQGFDVDRDILNLDTAFLAVKNARAKGPKIAIMAEYDALRQHFLPRVIVNPIITEGGIAQNTIPDKCSMKFSIRAEKKSELYRVLEKVEKCIEAAALVTGSSYEHNLSNYIYEDLTPNHALSNSFKANLDLLDVPYLDFESANYAWDAGNVSYVCPTIAPYIKIGPENLVGHTEDFKASSNSPEGFDGMIIGAKAMALTALDYLSSEELRKEVAEEFKLKVKE